MNKHETKIRYEESKLHTGLFIAHKNGTKTSLPDSTGYQNEDLMLSDFMVWLNNTHIINQVQLKNQKYVNELMSIYHIENEGTTGGKLGAIQGAISKGKGKKKGILDLHCCLFGLNCYLEAKLINGTFSDEQLYFISLLISWNIDVFIFRKFDFFKFVIESVILKRIYLGGGVWNSIEQIEGKLAS